LIEFLAGYVEFHINGLDGGGIVAEPDCFMAFHSMRSQAGRCVQSRIEAGFPTVLPWSEG